MLGDDDTVLYIGKARNLRNRVSSYFSKQHPSPRIAQMVTRIQRIEVTVTHSEDEALVLEYALIKERRPRYNISFRDDKSYPWLRISRAEAPRVSLHRGKQNPADTHFGPFPSAAAVRDTISTLQRTFRLRTCRDNDFANRSRPCLLFQINRCSAPCTNEISATSYREDVHAASEVLSGRGEQVVTELNAQMEQASSALNFEKAAELRDRIAALRRLQENRVVTDAAGDFDIVCVGQHHGLVGIAVMPIRGGQSLGTRTQFPREAADAAASEVLRSFVQQHYLEQQPPTEIVLSESVEDEGVLQEVLSKRADRKVLLHSRAVRGTRKRLQDMTQASLKAALVSRLADRETMEERYLALQERLGLDDSIDRMECFDISHTRGEGTRASCVVFGHSGPDKSQYRRFSIAGITPGDDYAAMRQAVSRRYARVRAGEVAPPDLLFIDGGAGQVKAATEALAEHGLDEAIRVVGVSKGPDRRPGEEELHFPSQAEPRVLAADDPALHLIQQIRDESHRFALLGHRAQRARTRTASELEEVSGLGAKRRSTLLRQFGGMAQLRRASLDEIARVPGISRTLAQRLYDHLHESN